MLSFRGFETPKYPSICPRGSPLFRPGGTKALCDVTGKCLGGKGSASPDEEGEGLHLTVGGKGSLTDGGREGVSH